ncbi:MAG: hypothetical protein ACI8T1_004526 [Verrucomicrobiales bacterium]|jgi:hypothetical protein
MRKVSYTVAVKRNHLNSDTKRPALALNRRDRLYITNLSRMNYPSPIILTTLATLSTSVIAEGKAPLWVVIGSENLQRAAAPLIELRREEGFEIVLTKPPVRDALTQLDKNPAYLLLLGDDLLVENPPEDLLGAERHTLYRWQATQPETFVSDAIFGDLDDDQIPDIPVGRLPGRTPEAISRLARKIVAYEKLPITMESLHIPVWAGNPAYGGAFQSNMASNLLRQTLDQEAPAWADLSLIMGNETDPLSAIPNKHADLFHDFLARGGGLFTGMMGHGGTDAFYSMPVANKWIAYHTSDTRTITGEKPASPAIIFACDCGNFAHPQTSLAEALLATPAGPAAVIAATTQSHPLPNYYSSVCWLQGLDEGSDRLGDQWVATQRRGYNMHNVLVELMLAEAEGQLEGKLNTPRIRKDHLLLYALLGDPATRLKRPQPLKTTFTRDGDDWVWTVTNPPKQASRLIVGHRTPPPPLKPKPSDLTEPETMELYEKTNAEMHFSTLDEHSPVTEWTGRVRHQRGTVRLVVQTDRSIFVSAHELKDS